MPIGDETTRSEIIPFDPCSHHETWTPALFGMNNPPVYEAARVGNSKRLATVVWLYRFFDADRALLYVGITINPSYRWTEHTGQPWWYLSRFASIEGIPPKERYAIEKNAIRTEQPLYNVTQKTAPVFTGLHLNRGPASIIEHLRDRMWAEDFAALVAAFHALPSTEES